MCSVVDRYAPVHSFLLKNNDKPWVTERFVDLVKQRNIAFAKGNMQLYNKLRNSVHRLGSELKKRFYEHKVDELRTIRHGGDK